MINRTCNIDKKRSLLFVIAFICPHFIKIIVPQSLISLVLYADFLLIIALCTKLKFVKRDFRVLFFVIIFVLCGLLSNVYWREFDIPKLIMPFFALVALKYISLIKTFYFKYIDYLFYIMYLYYGIYYYAKLPSLFIREDFLENVFDMASSNAIPITLNMTLISYLFIGKIFKIYNYNKLLALSFINFILVLIQHSRMGIMIAFLLFLFCLSEKMNFSYFNQFKKRILLSGLIVSCIVLFFVNISFIDAIAGDISIQSLDRDIRGDVQREFFYRMKFENFLMGYSKNEIFGSLGSIDINYVYNSFLDSWRYYGILVPIVIIISFLYRIVQRRQCIIPLIYVIPLLMYNSVERLMLPHHWDFLLYIFLFTYFAPKNETSC